MALRRGQLHVGHRPAPALGDRELEDLAETVARDDELFSEGFNTIDERTLPGSRRSRSSSVSRKCESGCVGATASAMRLRLFVERHLRAREHPHARAQRFQLTAQVDVPQTNELSRRVGFGRARIATAGGDRPRYDDRHCAGVQVVDEPLGVSIDVGQRSPFLGLGLPLGRTVVGVDIRRIVLPGRQHELHVAFGNFVHRCARRLVAAAPMAGG